MDKVCSKNNGYFRFLEQIFILVSKVIVFRYYPFYIKHVSTLLPRTHERATECEQAHEHGAEAMNCFSKNPSVFLDYFTKTELNF